jgi:AmmeMemoRadiSam system protein B
MSNIREPAVAGQFYPDDPEKLRHTIWSFLKQVEFPPGPHPKALVVPHAGYIYSGRVAAAAYARLLPCRNVYRRVVLLGPSHRFSPASLALSGVDWFRTPLGDVPVDRAYVSSLDIPNIGVAEAMHRFEHSLEVQLPFLQVVLESFSLVPLVVGTATAQVVAEVIERLWDGPETLTVVSTDLSHYLRYDEAASRDKRTCRAVERLDFNGIDETDACGIVPLRGLLIAARKHRLAVRTLDLRNSGDTAGTHNQVVGYGAWMFSEAA